ncbi:MAG: multicopper oxidase domain-containing protein [Proteobacteria bacterium]|nr:multicopper oxidase domain-containing protein [Pseudomonadota bacterium]
MIWRIWLGLSVVVIVGAWVLMVPLSPEPFSKSANNISEYRDQGLLPKPGDFVFSDAVPHTVFELPEEDARRLAEGARAMEGMDMGGGTPMAMDMGDGDKEDGTPMAMDMGDDDKDGGTPMAMDMGDDDKDGGTPMAMDMGDGDKEDGTPMAMDMGDGDEEDGTPMAMDMGDDDEGHDAKDEMAMTMENDEEGHGGGGSAFGISVLAQGSAAAVSAAASGLTVDRSLEIVMREWGYETPNIMVEPGEIIRLVLINAGKLPHEFMLMSGPGMGAVDYRLERADWNLLEHEAGFEVPIILPGDRYEVLIQIRKPGAWMFMCMFPFHMQLGLMGVMMTEGASMGGMNMEM